MATEPKLIERFARTLPDEDFDDHPHVKAARARVDAAHARLAEAQADIQRRMAVAGRAQKEAERLRLELHARETRIDAAALDDVSDGDFTFARACELQAEYQRMQWRIDAAERAARLIRDEIASTRPAEQLSSVAGQARRKLADVLARLKDEAARATPREKIVQTITHL